MIQKWFKMARLFTHLPDKEPDVEEDQNAAEHDDDVCDHGIDDSSDDDEEVLGTLYAHFYRIKHPNVSITT